MHMMLPHPLFSNVNLRASISLKITIHYNFFLNYQILIMLTDDSFNLRKKLMRSTYQIFDKEEWLTKIFFF